MQPLHSQRYDEICARIEEIKQEISSLEFSINQLSNTKFRVLSSPELDHKLSVKKALENVLIDLEIDELEYHFQESKQPHMHSMNNNNNYKYVSDNKSGDIFRNIKGQQTKYPVIKHLKFMESFLYDKNGKTLIHVGDKLLSHFGIEWNEDLRTLCNANYTSNVISTNHNRRRGSKHKTECVLSLNIKNKTKIILQSTGEHKHKKTSYKIATANMIGNIFKHLFHVNFDEIILTVTHKDSNKWCCESNDYIVPCTNKIIKAQFMQARSVVQLEFMKELCAELESYFINDPLTRIQSSNILVPAISQLTFADCFSYEFKSYADKPDINELLCSDRLLLFLIQRCERLLSHFGIAFEWNPPPTPFPKKPHIGHGRHSNIPYVFVPTIKNANYFTKFVGKKKVSWWTTECVLLLKIKDEIVTVLRSTVTWKKLMISKKKVTFNIIRDIFKHLFNVDFDDVIFIVTRKGYNEWCCQSKDYMIPFSNKVIKAKYFEGSGRNVVQMEFMKELCDGLESYFIDDDMTRILPRNIQVCYDHEKDLENVKQKEKNVKEKKKNVKENVFEKYTVKGVGGKLLRLSGWDGVSNEEKLFGKDGRLEKETKFNQDNYTKESHGVGWNEYKKSENKKNNESDVSQDKMLSTIFISTQSKYNVYRKKSVVDIADQLLKKLVSDLPKEGKIMYENDSKWWSIVLPNEWQEKMSEIVKLSKSIFDESQHLKNGTKKCLEWANRFCVKNASIDLVCPPSNTGYHISLGMFDINSENKPESLVNGKTVKFEICSLDTHLSSSDIPKHHHNQKMTADGLQFYGALWILFYVKLIDFKMHIRNAHISLSCVAVQLPPGQVQKVHNIVNF